MIVRVSPRRVAGSENDQFIGRLAVAEAQNRVSDRKLVDAMLGRGQNRRTPRRKSLDQHDGNWE